MSQSEAILDAVIDRIIPADTDPGALDLATPGFVRARLEADAALAGSVAAGMAELPKGFAGMTAEDRDRALREIEGQAWFAALVEVVQEGFWADPGNGGNRDAASWGIIGYTHGLPEGPTGPGQS